MKQICFVGDGVTLGLGDEALLGWTGRLCALERAQGCPMTAYNLGSVSDGSHEVAARWRREVDHRLGGAVDGGVVFQFGLNDMADVNGDGVRVPLMDCIDRAEAIVSEAAALRPVLWVGPAPVRKNAPPFLDGKAWLRFSNGRLQALNATYQAIAKACNVPYLDLSEVLAGQADWAAGLSSGNGIHPTAAGHTAIAAAVGRWAPWRRWMRGPMTKSPRPSQGHFTSGGMDISTASGLPLVRTPNSVPRS